MSKILHILLIFCLPAGLWAQLTEAAGKLPLDVVHSEIDVPDSRDMQHVYDGLFLDVEPLRLTLEFDVRKFQRTRTQEEYQPAEMTNRVNDTLGLRSSVRVKARGNYRRDNCETPPFWLNISNSGIDAPELEAVRRMKMVIPCKDSEQYEEYLLREYLVYRMYNLVSPYSYRVRLVRLKMVDTGRNNEETESWAFLIEPNEMLSRRLNAREMKHDNLSNQTVNNGAIDLLSMFQYMIGNVDFSVPGRHNLKILAMSSPHPTGFVPVPYDFDYSGLVNARYAVPSEDLGINSVRERYYLGPYRSSFIHLRTAEKIEAVREEIMEMILAFEFLPADERLDMIGYLEGFFVQVEKDRFVEQNIAYSNR